MKLGVNIDHVAVLREARKVNDPDIIEAMFTAIKAGADQITIHLREDRRHIQDIDVEYICKLSKIPVNLECSIDSKIIDIVCKNKPHRATIVPEKREEVTTEGGLDVSKNFDTLKKAVKKLKENEIAVSLFIDPNKETTKLSKEVGADMVEYHTGAYANIYAMLYGNLKHSNHSIKELELSRETLKKKLDDEIKTLKECCKYANSLGLKVAAGHGLNYQNVKEIAKLPFVEELNIGQSIVARSVFTGLEKAINDMRDLLK